MGMIEDLGPDMSKVGRLEQHERSAAALESVRYVLGASASTITRATSPSRSLRILDVVFILFTHAAPLMARHHLNI